MRQRTRTFTQCARKLPEFAEITQNNAITPFKVIYFGTNRKLIYDFLLVINTNLPPILHRFRDIAVDRSKIAILGYPSCVSLPRRRGSPGTISVKFSVDISGWPRYLMP